MPGPAHHTTSALAQHNAHHPVSTAHTAGISGAHIIAAAHNISTERNIGAAPVMSRPHNMRHETSCGRVCRYTPHCCVSGVPFLLENGGRHSKSAVPQRSSRVCRLKSYASPVCLSHTRGSHSRSLPRRFRLLHSFKSLAKHRIKIVCSALLTQPLPFDEYVFSRPHAWTVAEAGARAVAGGKHQRLKHSAACRSMPPNTENWVGIFGEENIGPKYHFHP